eukprot:7767268-Prorocentrum_lima.AAC.1
MEQTVVLLERRQYNSQSTSDIFKYECEVPTSCGRQRVMEIDMLEECHAREVIEVVNHNVRKQT